MNNFTTSPNTKRKEKIRLGFKSKLAVLLVGKDIDGFLSTTKILMKIGQTLNSWKFNCVRQIPKLWQL